jgi:hypothetical protein
MRSGWSGACAERRGKAREAFSKTRGEKVASDPPCPPDRPVSGVAPGQERGPSAVCLASVELGRWAGARTLGDTAPNSIRSVTLTNIVGEISREGRAEPLEIDEAHSGRQGLVERAR